MENSYVFHTVIQLPYSRLPRNIWTNLKQFKEGNWEEWMCRLQASLLVLRLLVLGERSTVSEECSSANITQI